jgi:hypothetical protein
MKSLRDWVMGISGNLGANCGRVSPSQDQGALLE